MEGLQLPLMLLVDTAGSPGAEVPEQTGAIAENVGTMLDGPLIVILMLVTADSPQALVMVKSPEYVPGVVFPGIKMEVIVPPLFKKV